MILKVTVSYITIYLIPAVGRFGTVLAASNAVDLGLGAKSETRTVGRGTLSTIGVASTGAIFI